MSEVFGVVKVMVSDQINRANKIAEEIANSRVNVGKVVHEIRQDENATDPEVKKYQEFVAKAEAAMEDRRKKIDEHIKTNLVKASEMSDEVFEQKKAEYLELKKGAQSAQKLAALIPGFSPEVFADVPALQTLSGGTAGGATGTKRPRLSFLSVNGEEVFVTKKADDGTESKSYTFTNAAAFISKAAGTKVSPSDLSAAAFEAAKTDDLSTVNDVEYSYSVDGQSYMVKVIPAQSAE